MSEADLNAALSYVQQGLDSLRSEASLDAALLRRLERMRGELLLAAAKRHVGGGRFESALQLLTSLSNFTPSPFGDDEVRP